MESADSRVHVYFVLKHFCSRAAKKMLEVGSLWHKLKYYSKGFYLKWRTVEPWKIWFTSTYNIKYRLIQPIPLIKYHKKLIFFPKTVKIVWCSKHNVNFIRGFLRFSTYFLVCMRSIRMLGEAIICVVTPCITIGNRLRHQRIISIQFYWISETKKSGINMPMRIFTPF